MAASVDECLAHAQVLEEKASQTAEWNRRSTLVNLAQQWREQAAQTIRHQEFLERWADTLRRSEKLKEQTARVLGDRAQVDS